MLWCGTRSARSQCGACCARKSAVSSASRLRRGLLGAGLAGFADDDIRDVFAPLEDRIAKPTQHRATFCEAATAAQAFCAAAGRFENSGNRAESGWLVCAPLPRRWQDLWSLRNFGRGLIACEGLEGRLPISFGILTDMDGWRTVCWGAKFLHLKERPGVNQRKYREQVPVLFPLENA